MELFQLLLRCSLLGLILFLPLFGSEQDKVSFFITGVFASTFIWLIAQFKQKFHFKNSLILCLASLFIVVLLISSLYGINPTRSIQGVSPYFQGWILYFVLFLFFLQVRSLSLKLHWWVNIWAAAAFGVSILAIKDWIFLHLVHQQVLNYSGRPISSFGSPNLYAGFLLLTLPILLKSQPRKLGYLVSFLSLLAIIASSSRTAIAVAVIIVFIWGVRELNKKWKSRFKQWVFVLGFILLIEGGILVARQVPLQFLADEIILPFNLSWQQQNAPEKRVLIWPVLIHQIKQRPVLGYGLENTAEVFRSFFPDYGIDYPSWPTLKDLQLDRAHNYLMDLAIWSGVVGVASWLVLVLLVIKKSQRSLLTACAVIYLFWIQFQIQSVVHLVFWWWLMAQVDRLTMDS